MGAPAQEAGKAAMAAATAFRIEVGGLRLRCIREHETSFRVQAHDGRKWVPLTAAGYSTLKLAWLRAVGVVGSRLFS